VLQAHRKKTTTAASAATAASGGSVTASQRNTSSLLDAPLDKMMSDPWALPARPPLAAPAVGRWDESIDTVTASSQPDTTWSSRRSPSPGL